jgi:hypothetical protein
MRSKEVLRIDAKLAAPHPAPTTDLRAIPATLISVIAPSIRINSKAGFGFDCKPVAAQHRPVSPTQHFKNYPEHAPTQREHHQSRCHLPDRLQHC